MLGDQAALAIHKAQLYEETRAQKEEATKLYGITAHLATTLDVDSVLDQVVAKTIDLLGCDASAVYVHDEARGGLVVRRGRHLDPAIVRDLVLKPGEGVAGRAYQERRPVSTADRLADPALRYETDHDRLIQSAPRAYLAVPVSVRDEVLGVLVCYYFAAHQFSAKEAQLLSSLAAHAAIAMDNARHHQAVMLQQNRLSQIFDATSDGMLLVSPAGRPPIGGPAICSRSRRATWWATSSPRCWPGTARRARTTGACSAPCARWCSIRRTRRRATSSCAA